MKTGFFEEAPGVKSSTRLNIFLIVLSGLLQVNAIIAGGLYVFLKSHGEKTTLLAIVTAAGALFGSNVIPCIIWKLGQKAQEPVPPAGQP